MEFKELGTIFSSKSGLELAILVGSRATGSARLDSDWDIAIQWDRAMGFVERLAAGEELRKELAERLGHSDQSIDLIDLPTARLAMRAVVAEEGVVLKGDGTLAWHHFLQRTWRELEEQYWEKIYAA